MMAGLGEKLVAAWPAFRGSSTTTLSWDAQGVVALNAASLRWHDEYHRQGHEVWFQRTGDLVLYAGAFLGEVIRRNHASATVVEWETHDEALARAADLVNVLGPKDLGNAVLLTPADRRGHFFPIGKVYQRVVRGAEHDLAQHVGAAMHQLRSEYGVSARP